MKQAVGATERTRHYWRHGGDATSFITVVSLQLRVSLLVASVSLPLLMPYLQLTIFHSTIDSEFVRLKTHLCVGTLAII
jgi:hypothetical protein